MLKSSKAKLYKSIIAIPARVCSCAGITHAYVRALCREEESFIHAVTMHILHRPRGGGERRGE